jgi:hypothetical protein
LQRFGFSAAAATLAYIRDNSNRLFIATTAPNSYSAASTQPQMIASGAVAAGNFTLVSGEPGPTLTLDAQTIFVEGSGSASHAILARSSGSTILAVTEVCGTQNIASGNTIAFGAWEIGLPVELQNITYTADNTTKLFNPERGFNVAYVPGGGGLVTRAHDQIPFPAFDSSIMTQTLAGTRVDPIYGGTFTTTFSELAGNISLVRLDFIYADQGSGGSGNYYEQALPQTVLDRFEDSMDALRAAGMKCILVFGYNWGVNNWDSTEFWMKAHIDQMAPLWETHKDVIAFFYAGLYGGTFEANASEGGTDNVTHLAGAFNPAIGTNNFPQRLSASGIRIYEYMLDNIPAERMMCIRFPRFKWDLLGITNVDTITSATAFDGSDRSRIGFASQGYMGNSVDFGMYQETGEESYCKTDSKWVPFAGEVSIATNSYNGTPQQVLTHSSASHLTSLNRFQSDALSTYNTWISNGDMDTVINKSGYRLRLVSGTYPAIVSRGSTVVFRITMANDGWGSVYNPRNVQVVMKQVAGAGTQTISLDDGYGNRRSLPWSGHTTTLTISGTVSANTPTGSYSLHLNMPDPVTAISTDPRYSIRTANAGGLWNSTTGYNSLNATIAVN